MMSAVNRQPLLNGNRNLVCGSYQFFIKPSYINKLTGFLFINNAKLYYNFQQNNNK